MVERIYPDTLIQHVKNKRVELGEYGGNRYLNGVDILEVASNHLSDPRYIEALSAYYKNGERVGDIAKSMSVSVSSVNKFLREGITEIAYRSMILFGEDAGVVGKDSSIRVIPCCNVRVLKGLEEAGYCKIKDLTGSTRWESLSVITPKVQRNIKSFLKSSLRNERIKDLTDTGRQLSLFDEGGIHLDSGSSVVHEDTGLPETKESAVEKENIVEIENYTNDDYNRVFVILRDLGDRVSGFFVIKDLESIAYKSEIILKKDLSKRNAKIISIDDSIKPLFAGDCSLHKVWFFRSKIMLCAKLEQDNILSLSDLSQLTKQEFCKKYGVSSGFADLVERELAYRSLQPFSSKKEVSTKAASKNPSPIVETTTEGYVSVEDLSEKTLPMSFLSYAILKGNVSKLSDDEILGLYQDYLSLTEERPHDEYVLLNLRDKYTEVPVGVIHIIEGFKEKVVFKKSQLSDPWISILMQLYVEEYADGFEDSWKKDIMGAACNICIDRFDFVDICDMYKFVKGLEWEMQPDKLATVYHYFRTSAEPFIKKPKEKEGYSEDLASLVELYNKHCSTPIKFSLFKEIDDMCRRLNISYGYAVSALQQTTSLKEINLLFKWFNFSYKNMKLYLENSKNIEQIMEV